ncbi:MAG: threonine synthase [Bifidobacteriaceae bacterium]|jgi:threonine synthase|nr:threonine synthase [Bifidobacteriaceae bacterium]
MAQIWRGVIAEYAQYLPLPQDGVCVSLGEGGTPTVPAPYLSEVTGAQVYCKYEGMNPTGSFKDRGMAVAISAAANAGAQQVICASTGNTSASAAAYATRAGLACAVLVPDGKIALGKLSQAIAHGARLLQIDGNFDDCLVAARKLADTCAVELVNSVNPYRIEGQKTAAFEVIDALGDAPQIHCLPVGNAGNITAYWKGYVEAASDGRATRRPAMWGFQAAGAAPIVLGHPVQHPETIATAIRIGNPASWQAATTARDQSDGLIDMVSDQEILEAHRLLSREVGIFVEPASAAGVAGLLKLSRAGRVPPGARIVVTVTGHGLKDPDWALKGPEGSAVTVERVAPSPGEIAHLLGLE